MFNLLRNSEPHRHDDAIISVRHSRREASHLPLIYISLHQHRPLRLQKSFIYESRARCFCSCSTEIRQMYSCLAFPWYLPPSSPSYNLVGVMWQGWILWVTAVWLPLLTRDKSRGRIFTAIYLALINSQLLCLPVFYILSRKLYFGTLETATSSFVRRIKLKASSLHHGGIKDFTVSKGGGDQCRNLGIQYLIPSALVEIFNLNEPNFWETPLIIHILARGNKKVPVDW